MRLTTSEKKEWCALQADGWTIHRNGWPDFLAEKDGKFRLIEVKTGENRLSSAQMKMCKALFRLTGLVLEVRHYKGGYYRPLASKRADTKRAEKLAWAKKYGTL